MVNRLVRREVEGRLALPFGSSVPDGLHLTRPCVVGARSIEALAADVIVALDAGAAAQAAEWCGTNRTTVVVEMVDDLEVTSRLVSWQIDRGARPGARADQHRGSARRAWRGLLMRLSSGPQPVPPTDAAADDAASGRLVRENWRGAGPVARPKCVIIQGSTSAETAARSAGLADHLEAAGVEVTTEPVVAVAGGDARNAALVVLAGVDRVAGGHRADRGAPGAESSRRLPTSRPRRSPVPTTGPPRSSRRPRCCTSRATAVTRPRRPNPLAPHCAPRGYGSSPCRRC